MRKDLSGKLVLDAGALVELTLSTASGLRLKNTLREGTVEAHTTELAILELRYVLCRRLSQVESDERVDKLLASGYIDVEDLSPLIVDTARDKCERAISLPDCCSLALARRLQCSVLFARRERELVAEMNLKAFDVPILFLEDHKSTTSS